MWRKRNRMGTIVPMFFFFFVSTLSACLRWNVKLLDSHFSSIFFFFFLFLHPTSLPYSFFFLRSKDWGNKKRTSQLKKKSKCLSRSPKSKKKVCKKQNIFFLTKRASCLQMQMIDNVDESWMLRTTLASMCWWI